MKLFGKELTKKEMEQLFSKTTKKVDNGEKIGGLGFEGTFRPNSEVQRAENKEPKQNEDKKDLEDNWVEATSIKTEKPRKKEKKLKKDRKKKN